MSEELEKALRAYYWEHKARANSDCLYTYEDAYSAMKDTWPAMEKAIESAMPDLAKEGAEFSYE